MCSFEWRPLVSLLALGLLQVRGRFLPRGRWKLPRIPRLIYYLALNTNGLGQLLLRSRREVTVL